MIIDLMSATGTDLDAAGEVHRKPRRNGEADEAYRARLIDETPADGGAAFGEFKQVGDCSIKTGGVSVRDYFAAKAFPTAWQAFENGYFECDEDSINASVATCAYQMADAMLAARGESK